MITPFLRRLLSRTLFPAIVALAALLITPSARAAGFTLTGAPFGQENIDAGAVLLPNGKVLIAGGTLDDTVSIVLQDGQAVAQQNSPAVATAQIYDPGTGTWTFTGSLLTARENHTLTLLPDGTVLAAGGSNGPNNDLASAEIYDPATGLWHATTPMNHARSLHQAVVLQNGTVLVVDFNSAEIYDPRNATWTTVGAPLGADRNFSAATLLPTGAVLAVGGNANQPDAELYNPDAKTWSATNGLSDIHIGCTLTVLANGQALLTGGENIGAPATTASAEVYDPGNNQWSTTGHLGTPRFKHSAALLPNGKVLVIGGLDVTQPENGAIKSTEVYDPTTGLWSPDLNTNVARASHTATFLANGKLLLVNGTKGGASSAELYDPATPFFVTGASSLTSRIGQTYTLLGNGQVLLTGGQDSGGTAFPQSELYDPQSDSWSATGPLQTARSGQTATLLANGKVLVVGGFVPGTANYVPTSETYDPATGQWTTTAGAPQTGHISHTATLLQDGRVIVAAGSVQTGSPTLTEIYDPGTDSWSPGPDIDQPRTIGASATQLPGGNVLLTGGDTDPTPSAVVYSPIDGQWDATGLPSAGRKFQTATLLPDGTVLVAGGQDRNGNTLRSAEIYHPGLGPMTGTDFWTDAQIPLVPLFEPTATLLLNGQVLFTGGDAGGSIPTEIYDPVSGQWSEVASIGNVRRGQSAVLLPTGDVFVTGGSLNSAATATVKLYDPGLGQDFDSLPQLPANLPPLATGDPLIVTGVLFTGIGGANSGTTLDSSTSYPIIRLESLVNEQVAFVPTTFQSGNAFSTAPVPSLPGGYARLTAFLNGAPSKSVFIEIIPGAPYVFTDTVDGLAPSSANLFAKVVANSSPVSVFFEYGTDPLFGTFSTTSEQVFPASPSVVPVNQPVGGLSAHTTYYYRAVARNAAGTTVGSIQSRSITTPNTPPTAGSDTATVTAGSPQTITLPFSTTDADGDPVSLIFDSTTNGEVLGHEGNQITVEYGETYSGPAQIDYTISDGIDQSSGVVTVTVTSPAPTAVADAFYTGAAKSTALSLDVLANDISSDPTSLMVVGVTQPEFGSVKIAPDGKSLTYTPRVAFSALSATDTFTYTEQDSTGMTATATVKVNNPSNLLKGTFDGLVGNGPNTGYLSIVLGANGSFTGKLRLGTAVSNFKGTLRLDGSADITVGATSVNVSLDAATGVITATIMQGSNFYAARLTRESFSAALAPAPQAGKYTAIIPRDNNATLTLQASATATVSSTGTISGITVANAGTGYTTPPLVTITGPTGSGATAVASVANGMVTGIIVTKSGSKYPASGVTVTIDPSSESRPAGAGYATINVATNGAASVTGKLGDGTAFSASGFVKADGTMALFSVLAYKKPGTLLGTLLFQDMPGESDGSGQLDWSKPAQTTAQRYQAGFATTVPLVAGRYVAPAKGENALDFGQAPITGAGFGAVEGDLLASLSDTISISTASVVKETSNPADKLTVKINPANGLVTGSFTSNFFAAPTGQKSLKVNFTGAIVQKQGIVGGFFLGPQHSGIFSFPTP